MRMEIKAQVSEIFENKTIRLVALIEYEKWT